MSVPEYVFLNRIREFYEQLRAGRNLWKIDETLHFFDERGRSMVKRWIQDEKYPWSIGRGYGLLTQQAPVISLVIQGDSDRPGGNFMGNYAEQFIEYESDQVTPRDYWQTSARIKKCILSFCYHCAKRRHAKCNVWFSGAGAL